MNAEAVRNTSELALSLLAQLMKLEHPNVATAPQAHIDAVIARATAMLATLQPTTAAGAMLAA